MPRLHPEALIFCIAWAALVVAAALLGGLWTGILLSGGLLVVIMPLSAIVISRTEDFAFERKLRWGVLVLAGLGLLLYLQRTG